MAGLLSVSLAVLDFVSGSVSSEGKIHLATQADQKTVAEMGLTALC